MILRFLILLGGVFVDDQRDSRVKEDAQVNRGSHGGHLGRCRPILAVDQRLVVHISLQQTFFSRV